MGLQITCDNCNVRVNLPDRNIPDGWIHWLEGDKLFCSSECVKAYLVKIGKPEEAAEYDEMVWMG